MGIEHDWVLDELALTSRGADRLSVCSLCGATAFEAGQAAVRDLRPPL